MRQYILNREKKLNALNTEMIDILRPQLEEWSKSDLCKIVVGSGLGRAFCAGGDVATVLKDSLNDATRPNSIAFFRSEYELDYILSVLPKSYIALLDGITMGGGVGLAISAPFRVATEKTVFAMPETKIGFCPDVGASFFLSRMDGQVGTYLALTSETLVGREVFEHGFATHYIPSTSIPTLMARLADLDNPTPELIDRAIEELHAERQPNDAAGKFTGKTRQALDSAFSHDTVEDIIKSLEAFASHEDTGVRDWAKATLETLRMRSPTSLKVALAAVRRGKKLSLLESLQMEMGIATAYCSGASPDFRTGISAVLIDKTQGRPTWTPDSIDQVTPEIVDRFFNKSSTYVSSSPQLTPPPELRNKNKDPMRFALPTEATINDTINSLSSGGSVPLSEVLTKFDDLRSGKNGVKEKVMDVVQRQYTLVDQGGSQFIQS